MRALFLLFFLSLLSPGLASEFEEEILPLLEDRCFKCHSAATDKPKADLRFDSVEGLADAAEDPGFSRILEVVILPLSDAYHMPPKGKEDPLTDEEFQLLSAWVQSGAKTGDFVAFNHEKNSVYVSGLSDADEATDVSTAAARIDALVAKGLKRTGTERSPEINDETFLRRAWLKIAGRAPTFEETKSFLKDDSPDKRGELIQTLLNSEAHVSAEFNYWADVFRAQTEQAGNLDGAWLFWLKDSIRNNTPWDEWVSNMLTAEGHIWDDPAIGFRMRDSRNRLAGYESTIAVFLGTEIGCAQCHDHPTEPLSQQDYYAMWGFLVGHHHYSRKDAAYHHLDYDEIRQSITEMHEQNRLKRVPHNSRERDIWLTAYLANAKALEVQLSASDNTRMSRVPKTYRYSDVEHGSYLTPTPIFGEKPHVPKEGEKANVIFADWLASADNLKFSHVIANRMWEKVMGVSLLGSLTNTAWPEDSVDPALADYLARLMVSCDYDLRHFQRILYNTRTWQSKLIPQDAGLPEGAFPGPALRRLSGEQLWDSLITLIVADVDQTIGNEAPDFSLPHELRAARDVDHFWKIVTDYVDEFRERTGKSVGSKGGERRRDMRSISALGFLEDELLRASELHSPAAPGHFLRIFGQGEREMINDHWSNATIPQALMLLNGTLHDRMGATDSAFTQAIEEAKTEAEMLDAVFLTVLSRLPDAEEREICREALANGQTPVDIAWALINTSEFLLLP